MPSIRVSELLKKLVQEQYCFQDGNSLAVRVLSVADNFVLLQGKEHCCMQMVTNMKGHGLQGKSMG